MFFGQHLLPLDEQRRLIFPAVFRALLGNGVFAFQGFERNLIILPQSAFEAICQQVGALSITDPLARLLRRMMLGTAVALSIDSGGGVTLPEELCAFADLGTEIVLVGQGKYLELWAPTSWNAQKLSLQDAEANAERFATLPFTLA